MAVAKHGGRPARTAWRVEDQFRDFVLLRCFPKTGKTHQIRVHLAHIGLPLAIDPLYGCGDPIFLSDFKRDYRRARDRDERPLIDRLTLHAHRLQFVGTANERVEIESEPPKDFRAIVNQLRRHAR
jgi:23S rRNA-/tRNA-specific pseudouridylate synthase